MNSKKELGFFLVTDTSRTNTSSYNWLKGRDSTSNKRRSGSSSRLHYLPKTDRCRTCIRRSFHHMTGVGHHHDLEFHVISSSFTQEPLHEVNTTCR